MQRSIFLLLVCFMYSISLVAQRTIGFTHVDSLRSSILSRQTGKLQEIAFDHQSDSIKKSVLQQLQTLNLQDSGRTRFLIGTLQALRFADSLRNNHLPHQIDSLKHLVTGISVDPFDKTLFYIYSPLGAFSPLDRVRAVEDKLTHLAHEYAFHSDSLTIHSTISTAEIQYAHQSILEIDSTDALWMNTSKEQLAHTYASQIAIAVAVYQQANSLQSFLQEAGLALLVIVLVITFIYVIKKLSGKLGHKIRAQHGKKIKGIRIRNYEVFNAGRQIDALLFVNNLVKWALIIVLVYLTLPVLFGIFPWTKGIATTLLGYFLNPAKKILWSFWNYLPNFFTVILIGVVFRYLLKGIHYLKNEIEKGRLAIPGFFPDWAAPTYQIIRVIVVAFMFILVFPYLPGSNSLAFKGVSVFLGVLFTFGSAGPLGNLISGLVLTYMRSFRVGDRVKINDVTGDIIEETLLVIRIRTIKNEIISIPNSSVLSSHTVNYSSASTQDGLVINTTVTMGYDTPWRSVHELLIEAALATEYIQADPRPFVLQTSLDDYAVSYQINGYTREANKQDVIYSNLYQNIQDLFNKAGLELLSPQYITLKEKEIRGRE